VTTPTVRGWYARPGDPDGLQRWWDGKSWTDRTTGSVAGRPASYGGRGHPAVELATAAKNRGERFFQFELELGHIDGNSRWGSSDSTIRWTPQASVIGQIEQCGWRLEHVGYVYVNTGSLSTNRVLRTGEGTAERGKVAAIYLFRRDEER
jgi:Protein of unknown function (DUF2510)